MNPLQALLAFPLSLLAQAPTAQPGALSALDRAEIRAAYETARHEVRMSPEGHVARNPGQCWTTVFDGRGSTVRPDGGAWTWGLELARWGRECSRRASDVELRACASGGRLEYEHEGGLVEWYVNDARGLEHGFTLRERPTGEGELQLELAVRGGLAPLVDVDGLGARFVDAHGASALRYDGLFAFDADGEALRARMELEGDALLLTVDDAGARYPLTIDPVAQQAYLKASNTDGGDQFGRAVALSGDTIVVGANFEGSGATGVDGDQADDAAPKAGAAYVFVRGSSGWQQQAYLKASNTDAVDHFGEAVAISGDTIAIGAWGEDSAATGVGGEQGDDSASVSGAVYVFVRSGTAWAQQAYLKASNTGSVDLFGSSVAVSGDTIVVGANGEDSDSTGVDGDGSNDDALVSGAAYVFVREGGTWSQQAYLKASNTGAADRFGWSVAISGDTIVVGATGEDSSATGVDGDQGNNDAFFSGAAYVFVRSGTTWAQQAYLKASNTGIEDRFGTSVSVSGDLVIVGAPEEGSDATGVNGDQGNDDAQDSGAAYVFVREGATWSQQAYLKASNADAFDNFGSSVAIAGDKALVGAPLERSRAAGVDGDQEDDSTPGAGAAYLFGRAGASWSQEAYLKASDTWYGDFFGHAVAMDEDDCVVGAPFEASAATGVNGDQFDQEAADAGAAYVFALDLTAAGTASCFGSPADCPCGNGGAPGRGCDNAQATGGVLLSAAGSPAANDVVLLGSGYPLTAMPGVVAIRSALAEPSPVVFGDGLRCVSTIGLVRLGATGAFGGASSHPLSHGAGSGTFHYQLWYRNNPASFCDPAAAFNLSNGLSILWP